MTLGAMAAGGLRPSARDFASQIKQLDEEGNKLLTATNKLGGKTILSFTLLP